MIYDTFLSFALLISSVLGAKRGILLDYTAQNQDPHAIDRIPSNAQIVAISNWNTWCVANLNGRFPFVPTIRTPQQLEGDEWSWAWNNDGPEIIGFNEPERQGISPQQAAQYWFSHMVPLRQQRGKKLIGPSVANDEAGKAWLSEFMSSIQSQRPDMIGLHLYHTDGDRAIQYLQEIYETYRIPITITELASTSRNYVDVLYFTAQLCNFCDSTWWIDKYYLFAVMPRLADNFVSPAAQLCNSDMSFRDLLYKYMYDCPIIPSQQAVALGTGTNAYH